MFLYMYMITCTTHPLIHDVIRDVERKKERKKERKTPTCTRISGHMVHIHVCTCRCISGHMVHVDVYLDTWYMYNVHDYMYSTPLFGYNMYMYMYEYIHMHIQYIL